MQRFVLLLVWALFSLVLLYLYILPSFALAGFLVGLVLSLPLLACTLLVLWLDYQLYLLVRKPLAQEKERLKQSLQDTNLEWIAVVTEKFALESSLPNTIWYPRLTLRRFNQLVLLFIFASLCFYSILGAVCFLLRVVSANAQRST